MNDSNETPISPDAANTEETAAKAASVRKLLRAKITAVLQLWPKVTSARGSYTRANEEYNSRWKIFQGVHLPPTEDESRVRQYLAASQDAYRAFHDSSLVYVDARAAQNELEIDWYTATLQLSQTIDQAAEVADLANDDVYLAARRLHRLAPVPNEAPSGWTAEPPPKVKPKPSDEETDKDEDEKRELTDTEKAQLSSLTDAVLVAAKVVAHSFKVGPAVVAKIAEIRKRNSEHVTQPNRPTEEEIQRYLRQVELRCETRQADHWELDDLLNQKQKLLEKLTEASRALDQVVEQLPSKDDAAIAFELKSMLHVASVVDALMPKAENCFGEDYDKAWLFTERKPKMTARETRQRDELRKMMRQMAIAMASLNEATSALNIASKVPLIQFSFTGAGNCGSWQEALEWRQREQERHEDVKRQNEQRDSKIELLKEAKERYERDKKDASKDLRRYMLTILPSEPEIPSDEMRNIINAVAYMTTPARDSGDHRTGDYPVY